MAGNVYYKIPPEWAERLNVSQRAPQHPDGWHIILPPVAVKLARSLAPRGDGRPWTPEEAVAAIGGVGLTMEEALKSQRGEEGYRMDRPRTSEETFEIPAETPVNEADGTQEGGEG